MIRIIFSGGVERGSSHLQKDRRSRGQDLLEFALVFPVLLLLVVAAVDIGRVFLTGVVVANAAREGTRFAISYGIQYDQSLNKLLPVNNGEPIKTAVEDEAGTAGINLNQIVISCLNCLGGTCTEIAKYDCTDGTCDPVFGTNTCLGGQPVRLTVSSNFLPILSFLFGSPMTITRSAEMMIPSGSN